MYSVVYQFNAASADRGDRIRRVFMVEHRERERDGYEKGQKDIDPVRM